MRTHPRLSAWHDLRMALIVLAVAGLVFWLAPVSAPESWG